MVAIPIISFTVTSLAFREVAVLIRGAISYQTTSYENSED